jgi:L-aminopeptidase/D-esterase-like protein
LILIRLIDMGSKSKSKSSSITRRDLLRAASITPFATAIPSAQSRTQTSIIDVAGIKVGHFTDRRRPTGCTVILTEEGAMGGVDVRGAAPGTRETDLLSPLNSVQAVHAIVLAGGSTFGLEAATGVVRYLEEKGIGIETRAARIPIVPAAILYDLGIGDTKIRPDAEAGYRACKAATDQIPEEGNVGAGSGATVGKLFGMDRAMKGGIGSFAIKLSGGPTVGAIVAVNAVGDIIDPQNGRVIAGARTVDGKKTLGAMAAIMKGEKLPPLMGGTATTIGVVATDAILDKAQANKIAQMAHDGLARAINPVHTAADGDAIFALATGRSGLKGNVTLIGSLAAEAMAQAIVRAVRAARGIAGIPSANDLT